MTTLNKALSVDIIESCSFRYLLKGDPTPWMRAGVSGARFYDQQRHIKLSTGFQLRDQHEARPAHLKALRLVAVFYMPMAQSWSSKKRDLMRGQYHFYTPDTSNLIKFIEDVSVEVGILRDDCLIASQIIDKIYDDNPRTEFIFQEL